VFFVGFNVEQLARNQRIGARSSPLKHPTIVPAARPRYLDGETLQPQPQPMHASFITLLSHDPRRSRPSPRWAKSSATSSTATSPTTTKETQTTMTAQPPESDHRRNRQAPQRQARAAVQADRRGVHAAHLAQRVAREAELAQLEADLDLDEKKRKDRSRSSTTRSKRWAASSTLGFQDRTIKTNEAFEKDAQGNCWMVVYPLDTGEPTGERWPPSPAEMQRYLPALEGRRWASRAGCQGAAQRTARDRPAEVPTDLPDEDDADDQDDETGDAKKSRKGRKGK
jgi:hypothetical protein